MGGFGRRLGALALGVTVLGSAVACGGESAEEQAYELILGAAAATFAEGTAEVLVDLEGLGEGAGQIDFENGLSQVDVDLDGEPTTVIVDGTDVYVGRDDSFTQDLSGLPDLGTLLLYLQPIQALQILNGAQSDDLDIVGDDTLDGVDVTQYRVRIDLQAALDALDGDARRALQAAIDAAGVDQLTVDVWLDADGVVRRMVSSFKLDDGTTKKVTLNFSDFGKPVRIRVPRPREVLENADQFLLATADISGTWTGTTTFVSATDTVQWPTGRGNQSEIELDMSCRPNGSCVNSASGSRWSASGPGEFTIETTDQLHCVDQVTGEPGAAGGYVETYVTTWRVTAQEDGQATAMASQGEVTGTVTAVGQAENCQLPQGGVRGTAQFESEATRSG